MDTIPGTTTTTKDDLGNQYVVYEIDDKHKVRGVLYKGWKYWHYVPKWQHEKDGKEYNYYKGDNPVVCRTYAAAHNHIKRSLGQPQLPYRKGRSK